ncbi:3531_t:CDS:2 [Cetraspora pellucida]|uniref:3531_t:CDS:1 n=1 Tax=Cetraspora pellucida TaxID=1433469 RepID=A0A9N8ZKJ0_9GLOM|nr:3531_t:CDS:2 [Cetraspora pellucida]
MNHEILFNIYLVVKLEIGPRRLQAGLSMGELSIGSRDMD